MYSILMVLGTVAAPTGADAAALHACAPDKHAACVRPAQKAQYQLPVGKRCHADPSKSVGCRERLPGSADHQSDGQ